MTKFIYSIILFLAPTLSHAQSLKDTMSTMGQNFKVIALSIKAKELTLATMSAAEELSENISVAESILPESALTDEQKIIYKKTMLELAIKNELLIQEIKAALETNPKDIAKAEIVFKEIMAIRTDGHTTFKID